MYITLNMLQRFCGHVYKHYIKSFLHHSTVKSPISIMCICLGYREHLSTRMKPIRAHGEHVRRVQAVKTNYKNVQCFSLQDNMSPCCLIKKNVSKLYAIFIFSQNPNNKIILELEKWELKKLLSNQQNVQNCAIHYLLCKSLLMADEQASYAHVCWRWFCAFFCFSWNWYNVTSDTVYREKYSYETWKSHMIFTKVTFLCCIA